MMEHDMQIAMPDGIADAVLFSPDPSTPLPGVLHFPDIASIREAHRAMARRLASQGHAVLMPNPFHRTARPPVWDFPRKMGDPRTMQRFAELIDPLTPEAQHRDATAYVKFLTAQPAVRTGPIGVVGYCFGGAMALRIAAAFPGLVAAAASFHGGGLYKSHDANSPHLLLSQITAQLYFGHAVDDRSMTAEDIVNLEQSLAAWNGKYESETYVGTSHGWTVSDNPAFKPPQAERAFAKLIQLFAQTLL